MGFLDRVFQRSTKVASTPDDIENLLRQTMMIAANGVEVTPSLALRVPEVLACVNVISQAMSMLPFSVYDKSNGERKKDTEHRVGKLLSMSPNDVQSSFEFMRMMTWHAASSGNAYAHVTRLGGRVLRLIPLHPKWVTPVLQPDWTVEYKVRQKDGISQTYTSDEIFHLRGPLSVDAHVSESPVVWCRDAIATLMVVEKFTGKFFKGGAKAKGAFSLPGEGALGDEAFDRLKAQLNDTLTADQTMVLEQGLGWVPMDYSARESLLSDISQQQVIKMCRIWRVQPHLIQSLDGATFSNIEQQSREFVDYTMMPWIRLWESAIHNQLMDPENLDVYPRFSVQSLLRGDSEARSKVYQAAVGGPYMTPNEARNLEDMDEIEGGDELLRPLNMGDADNPPEVKPNES